MSNGVYDQLKTVMDKLSTKRPVLEKMTEADAQKLFGPMMALDFYLGAVIGNASRVLDIIERIEIDQALADDAP